MDFKKPNKNEKFVNINVKLNFAGVNYCRGLGNSMHKPIDKNDHNLMIGCREIKNIIEDHKPTEICRKIFYANLLH
jgi:hypothetical protein